MFNTHNITLVDVNTTSGAIRWAIFAALIIATIIFFITKAKVRKKKVGPFMLALTIIATPFLLLTIVKKNIGPATDVVSKKDKDDSSIEVPKTNDNNTKDSSKDNIVNIPDNNIWAELPNTSAENNDNNSQSTNQNSTSNTSEKTEETQPSQPDQPDNPNQPDNPDEPVVPTKYHLTINNPEFVAVDISGDYEKDAELFVAAIDRESSDYFFEYWKDNNDNQVSTNANYEFTMPESDYSLTPVYRFEDPFPEVWSQTGTCSFVAYQESGVYHGQVSGTDCSNYAGQEYIDTGISLYSAENINKDYEVSFTIDHFDPAEQLAQSQETVFTDKGYNWKAGVVYRQADDKLSILSRNSSSDSEEERFEAVDGRQVSILRFDGDLYYKHDNSAYILLHENVDEIEGESFDISAWFGAAPNDEEGTIQKRFITGELSNMSIKLGEKKFTELVEITFNPNGGTLAHNIYYAERGNTIGALPVATRSKKALVAWRNANGEEVTPETVINDAVEFTAEWINNVEAGNLATVKIETVVGEDTPIRISNLDTIEPVTYSSNNNYIAVVSDSGVVTGAGIGETDINITGAISGVTRTVHVIVHGARLTVHFDAGEGAAVDDVYAYPDSNIDPLPHTTREGYTFLGWFDEYGDELESDTIITTDGITYYARWDEGVASKTLVCKKATTRHTETCNRTTGGCYAAGHSNGSDIIYGILPDTSAPEIGYAYDCDVNGDNKYNANTERFYYIGSNGDNGILISFSNFEGPNGQQNENIFGYDLVDTELPTTTQWANENLVQFNGKPARILAKSELQDSCGASTNTGSLDTCEFLLENTKYAGEDNGRSAYWLIKTSNTYNRVYAPNRNIGTVANTSNNAIRPVIEVPLEYIQQGSDVYVTFEYGDGRPDEQRGPIGPNEIVGDLPIVSNTEHATFLGWFTETTGGERIGKYTVPAGDDTHYYAHWDVNQYSVTFNKHNETDDEEISVTYNTKIGNQAPADPIRNHYTFAGWYTAETDGDRIEDITDYTVLGNVTLHAQWTAEEHTVTFNLHNNSDNETIQVEYGTTIGSQAPVNPTRNHYAFAGWYTAETDGDKITNISAYVVEEDVELHAHWNPIAVCRVAKEETLHVEKCTNNESSKGCRKDGYTLNADITYGIAYNKTDNARPDAGTAFDCDVNGDGTYDSDTERFYYLYASENTGILLYHKNTQDNITIAYDPGAYETPKTNKNDVIPTIAIETLPTNAEWSNVELLNPTHQIKSDNGGTTANNKTLPVVDYTGYAARMATVQDIRQVCSGSLNQCKYLLEATTYGYSSGAKASGYLLESPVYNSGTKINIAHGSSYAISAKEANNITAAGVRAVIEVPFEFFDYDPEEEQQQQSSDEIVSFDMSNEALKGYYSTITPLIPYITTFNKDETAINDSTWGVAENDFLTAIQSNFEYNQCNTYKSSYNNESSFDWASGANDCSKPVAYNTEVNGAVDVYLYDEATSTLGDKVDYTNSSNGYISNMIPGQTYRWVKSDDDSVYGYVRATASGDRRIIDAGRIRNIRDLGGLTATYTDDDNVTKSGTLRYEKLFRGEKMWNNQDDADMLLALGVDKEYALLDADDGSQKLDDYVRINFTHYSFDSDATKNAIARDTITSIMQDVVNGTDIYFHCRVGADRTGTVAYILEGLLGVPDEERYEDYELTHLSGLTDRTRYYKEKVGGADPAKKKFVYMMGFLQTKQDIYDWYMDGSTDEDADKALIQAFRDAMINYN